MSAPYYALDKRKVQLAPAVDIPGTAAKDTYPGAEAADIITAGVYLDSIPLAPAKRKNRRAVQILGPVLLPTTRNTFQGTHSA